MICGVAGGAPRGASRESAGRYRLTGENRTRPTSALGFLVTRRPVDALCDDVVMTSVPARKARASIAPVQIRAGPTRQSSFIRFSAMIFVRHPTDALDSPLADDLLQSRVGARVCGVSSAPMWLLESEE
jgi:hypothetical protein